MIKTNFLHLSIWSSVLMIFFSSMSSASEGKFKVEGATLFYDSFAADTEELQEITWEDLETFSSILKSEPGLKTINLNSSGGEITAALEIADLIIDFELDTNVDGTCDSACTTIFLAGNKRTVERGSKLGFHQSYWDAEYIENFYDSVREYREWETPFEFASWLYSDTQQEILKKLEYLVERGVDAGFAIKTMQATSDDMWYPRRKELEAAGVIVE